MNKSDFTEQVQGSTKFETSLGHSEEMVNKVLKRWEYQRSG